MLQPIARGRACAALCLLIAACSASYDLKPQDVPDADKRLVFGQVVVSRNGSRLETLASLNNRFTITLAGLPEHTPLGRGDLPADGMFYWQLPPGRYVITQMTGSGSVHPGLGVLQMRVYGVFEILPEDTRVYLGTLFMNVKSGGVYDMRVASDSSTQAEFQRSFPGPAATERLMTLE